MDGESLRSIAQEYTLASLPSRIQMRPASANFTHVRSLSGEATPPHLTHIYHTPPSKPSAFAYAARSLPSHLRAQSRPSKSGKMYPFPAYHSPSPTPHPLEWVGGDYSSYALPTGFQQIYHAQRMYQGENNGAMTTPNPYDPFTASTPSLATSNNATHQAQVNPYTQDMNTMGGASYYQGQNNFAQPVRLRIRHLRVAGPKLNGSLATVSSLCSTRPPPRESATLPKSGP